jgi:preprotein translocase subunit Sec61beta
VDYSKLTVTALKALCRERKITGYSKLAKAGLVSLLQQSDTKEVKVSPLAPFTIVSLTERNQKRNKRKAARRRQRAAGRQAGFA